MHMIKHEGDTITEIEAPDTPTSTPMHQILVAMYLLIYSIRLGNLKNGLEENAIPVTFVTIACMAGKSINIIYTIGGFIATFAIHFLINYVKLKLFSNVIFCSHMHNVRLFISRVQNAMEIEWPVINPDKLLKYVINGYTVCTEIADIFVLMVQYDMFELTLLHFFTSVLRRWIRGTSITLLSVTVATDVIEKCITTCTCEDHIRAKSIRKLEIGRNSRISNYIMLSTVVIFDAIITERHEIVVIIGSIGLIVRTAILFIAKFKSVTASPLVSQNSANNCENQETLTEPGSQPSPTNSLFQQQIRQRRQHDVPSASQWKNQATQTIAFHQMMATNTQYMYKMKSNPCGIAVIISNEEFKAPSLESRSGSSIDAYNLCNLLNYLGFVTQCHNNKTHTEMRHILNNISAMDHDKYDCLMVAILTHGDYGDVLYGTAGGRIVIQEVIETFSSKRCPTLIDKPKIFIVQACRGRRHNQTVQLNDIDNVFESTDSCPTLHPNISDYLIAYSTIPGHVSIRNNKIGSVFISILVRVFKRYAAYEDLLTMLERVTDGVTEYKPLGNGLQDTKQSPEVRYSLRRKVYFITAGKCKCD